MLNINKFFQNIKLKKNYINKLKNNITKLSAIKEENYKFISLLKKKKAPLTKEGFLVKYIVDITFSRSNTLLHVMDYAGNMKFFCSAGLLKYKGKQKKARYLVFRDLYRLLLSKLKFLKYQPIALHLKNIGFAKAKIVKRFRKNFFIAAVKSFNIYPHNGCRKRKMRRKKFRKKLKMTQL